MPPRQPRSEACGSSARTLAMTDPDLNHVHGCLAACEFLVVQEIFLSETARFAHVVLPAAASVEKAGTFTNTERRMQRFDRGRAPPGDARPDWWIIAEIGRRLMRLDGARAPSGHRAEWDVRFSRRDHGRDRLPHADLRRRDSRAPSRGRHPMAVPGPFPRRDARAPRRRHRAGAGPLHTGPPEARGRTDGRGLPVDPDHGAHPRALPLGHHDPPGARPRLALSGGRPGDASSRCGALRRVRRSARPRSLSPRRRSPRWSGSPPASFRGRSSCRFTSPRPPPTC